jgi:hypothetical protein
MEDLDYLLEGQSAEEVLRLHGAQQVGKRGDVAPESAGRRANELFVTGAAENTDLVAVAFTLTRVLAVMKDLGK